MSRSAMRSAAAGGDWTMVTVGVGGLTVTAIVDTEVVAVALAQEYWVDVAIGEVTVVVGVFVVVSSMTRRKRNC